MTDAERDKKFRADFGLLLRNRTQAPLELLQTKYAKGYNRLVSEVEEGADWFFNWFLKHYAFQKFPRHPLDTEGNAWLEKRMQGILLDENRPGGRREKYIAALIDHLNMDEYEQIVWEVLDRMEQEAYYPYWMRHCYRRGGRIWSDIFYCWWKPRQEGDPGHGAGYWEDGDRKFFSSDYPPRANARGREMPVCKGCGAPIVWHKTAEGKSMPCSPVPYLYRQRPGGSRKVLTLYGKIVSCEWAWNDKDAKLGYLPHWAVCPCQKDFKKAKGRT